MEKLDPTTRPPIVAIVGHIDHGKSTLLDYIRRTNVVESEAGGITQHLSAYEAEHTNENGPHRITFLDTPGHEAFRAMRSRGLEAADVAILVVSAEDGVKPQTLEALALLGEAKVPYIVAFTKIDKPTANLEKAKLSLLENNVFVEGMGGEIPWVGVSGKTGAGIPELLDLILLQAELEGLTAHPEAPAEGLVIEAHVDAKRGNTATLIVRNGSIRSGEFAVVGDTFAPVRIMENFVGKPIKEALPGSPVRIVGFSTLPKVGEAWRTVETKKQAEQEVIDALAARKAAETASLTSTSEEDSEELTPVVLPLIIKTDVAGTGEAVVHELKKLTAKEADLPPKRQVEVRVLETGVGTITEGDVRLAGAGKTPGIIVGFNVKVEREATDTAERLGVLVETFDVIYKLAEWLEPNIEERRRREMSEEMIARARVLKVFNSNKNHVVLGGRVEEGELKRGTTVKILRKDEEIGRAEIVGLQAQRESVNKVEAGKEFGAELKTDVEPKGNDELVAFTTVLK